MRHIETDRLILRNFVVPDWEALKEIVLQYQASEYAAFDHQWPTDDDELKKITSWFAGGDDFLAVCLKDTGRLPSGWSRALRSRTRRHAGCLVALG